jgi:hypothetical protein
MWYVASGEDRMSVERNDEFADGLALVALELEPREQVIWSGRPESVRPVVLRNALKAIIGAASLVFLVFCMILVVRGGHNRWDRGQAVPPFAPHNVLRATIAGVWITPFCLYLLLWPLRTWRRLNRTCYALTDRRALIVEPDIFGRGKARSFTPDALRLMRVEERSDGTGDVIFGSSSNWTGMAETTGFLGIDQPGDIEALVRKTLFPVRLIAGHSAELFAGTADRFADVPKTYRLAFSVRLFQFVSLVVGSLMGVCILGDVILIGALLIIGPKRLFGPRPPGLRPIADAETVVATVAGLGFSLLMAVVVCAMFFHFALRIPFEITIDGGRQVRFRGRIRTVTVPVSDLVLIQTGRWFDPNRIQLDIIYKRGKLMTINRFSDFADFLATVKELNRSLEIKGF